MNWIESIGEAINYIENNLNEPLTVEEIANHAYISSGYFQKAFAMLCGFTVGEYIRNRRLSKAGTEVLSRDKRIIDIALKYGYDSHDSFTKAFTRFHGATPSAVRRGGHMIKSFAPLQVNFLLKGGYIMDYRIEKQDGFEVLLKIDEETGKISYWSETELSEPQKLMITDSFRSEGGLWREITTCPDELERFELHTFPATTWAVFECKGNSRDDAREKTFQQIMREWFPQTNYVLDLEHNPCVSYQSAVKSGNNASLGVFWIPIKEKVK